MRAAGLAFNSCCQSATKPDPRRRRGQTEIQQCATKMMRGAVCLARRREKRSGPGPRGREGKRPGVDAKAKGPRGSRCGPSTPSPAWYFGNLTKRDSCPSRSTGVVNRMHQPAGTMKDLSCNASATAARRREEFRKRTSIRLSMSVSAVVKPSSAAGGKEVHPARGHRP